MSKPLLNRISSAQQGLSWRLLFGFILFFSSCKKNPIEPPAIIPNDNPTLQINLGNKVIPFWGRIETIDFDKDNFPELIFEIVPIGDHILKRDCWQW